ncbi:MAG: inverse autotransporter beta domain-containing protein [Enterobacterales bacterium endosymbiont of Blomia tropicalis]|uniref:inverse autotransporter beta domain-containing protein n=1 Tax=Mixta mediterraneensis TaxID=2758443 RepID=UPI0025A85C6A|nr:inverse autotransporter beta domain-containing protein [Mixta mediterraneensis]MDL4915035.1 inverse autotransporter beta domain-containing protein [Mixta mediterraneensis]
MTALRPTWGWGCAPFSVTGWRAATFFFDDDLSRYHYRAGLGLEYGRDNLKLSANRYLRLSGWRDAKEPEDYEARPANGWDLRSEAWLPAYPQLGGKLMYEQYYGNEVALFGTDHRQRSPRAVTAGITWTPVPLVTFSAERKQGQSGVSDARFGVDFRIQPGVPWHRQFSPDAVAVLRSLAGSRYDLVDRNNNIVLEYRRKKVIRLHLSPLITGWSGEMKSLGASVNSKYGLDYIDWDAPLLLARGGKIVADGAGGYNVVLPAWQYDAQGSNTYTVGGVAVDKKGNTSARAEAQVTVTQPAISAISSTLTPPESVMPADGRTQQTLTLSLKDSRGQQVDVGEGEITVSTKEKAYAGKDAVPAAAAKSQPAMTAFRRQSAGIYTAVVTAGTIPDRYSVTPAVRGVSIPEAVISLAADSSTASVTAVALDGDIIMKPASGASSFNYSVTVQDNQGNPVEGAVVEAAADKTGVSVSGGARTGKDGHATVTLTGTTTAVSDIMVTAGTGAQQKKAADRTVSFVADSSTATVTALEVTADNSMADGRAQNAVRATVKDAGGNAVANAAVRLTAPALSIDGKGDSAEVTTDAQGQARVTLTGSVAGQFSVTAAAAADGGKGKTVTVTFVAGQVTQGTIATDKTSYVAGTDMALTVTLKDTQGNPVSGQSALLTAGAVTVANAALKGKWKDNGDGSYAVAYTAVTAGSGLKASLTLSSGRPAESAAYAITAGAVTQGTIATDKTSYVAGTDMALTVTLKDTQGNPVSGQSALLTAGAVTVANAALKGKWKDNGDGSYAVAYTAVTAGSGLKASLTLSSGRPAESAAYAITAGAVTQGTIATDKTSYVAGTDMALTVTLKDTQGNPVSGQSALLTAGAVTVANAALKSDWTDNNDGSYGATYTATTAGSGLKASLTLSSGRPVASAAYEIYAAPAVKGGRVTISGGLEAGSSELTAEYAFESNGTGEDASTYQWQWRPAGSTDEKDWKNGQQDGHDRRTYKPGRDYAGDEVRVIVTPVGKLHPVLAGAQVISNVVTMYGAPSVANVKAPATSLAGKELDVTYDYSGNGSGSDASSYQWEYRQTPSEGWTVPQSNAAKNRKWTPDASYAGYQVRLTVTPKGSLHPELAGTPVSSDAVAIYAAPSVAHVKAPATSLAGKELDVTYDYSGNGSGSDASSYQWEYRQTPSEGWTVPQSNAAKNRKWTPDASYAGYQVRLTVTPKGSLHPELAGTPVSSDAVAIYAAPSVAHVKAPATSLAGKELDVTYDYSGNGSGSDASSYQWEYRQTPSEGWTVPQSNAAKNRKWTPDASYAGYQVRLTVTPKGSLHPELAGTPVSSDAVAIYAAPSVAHVKAPATSLAGKELDVTYDYSGNGSGSDASSYQWEYRQTPSEGWTVPQSNAAKNRKWTPDASYAGYQVRLTVTPKGSLHPELAGTPVSSDAVSIYDLKAPRITWSACWVVGSIWNRAPELSFTWDTTNIPPGINIVIGDSIRRPASDGKFEKQVVNQETRVYFMDSYGNKSNAITITSLITFSCDTFVNED